MSNMNYCRFENTLRDLADCYGNMSDELNGHEEYCRKALIALCVEIALDYGHEVGRNLDEDE